MNKQDFQTTVLVLLLVSSIGLVWSLPAEAAIPAFQSPPPIPLLEEVQILPTPRPPVVLSPSEVILGQPTLTTNLNGYWQLDETDTGNRSDSSPNGSNPLTNVGGVSWVVNGREGTASDFEADNSQYLKIESFEAAGLNFYHSFTLMGWLKRESLDDHMMLASKYAFGSGLDDRAYRLQLSPENRLRLIVSPDGTYDPGYRVTGSAVLDSTSTWVHVAGVFDAGAQQIRLYVNGALDAEQSITFNSVHQSAAPFMLGANLNQWPTQSYQYFDGQLDGWRAYNRVLSQSEIQQAMGGLKGHWALDETSTGPRLDSSGQGNDLTNIGGVGGVAGQVGNAALLNNPAVFTATQYLKIDDSQSSGLNFNDSFTLVGWLKRNSVGSSLYTVVAGKYEFGTVGNRAYRLHLGTNNRLRLIVSPDGVGSNANYFVDGATPLTSTTAWVHVAGVFDAGTQLLKLYVDGNLDGSKSVVYNSVYQSSVPFMLGANVKDGVEVQGFDGQLDAWRVYDRPLSQNEIQALMNAQ